MREANGNGDAATVHSGRSADQLTIQLDPDLDAPPAGGIDALWLLAFDHDAGGGPLAVPLAARDRASAEWEARRLIAAEGGGVRRARLYHCRPAGVIVTA